MSDFKINHSISPFGFCVLLSMFFMILKIKGFIDWSMWLILAPILINIGMIFLGIFCLGLVCLILLIKNNNDSKTDDQL